MNKFELVSKIAEKTGKTKKLTEKMVNTMLDTMQETLASGEDIKLVGAFSLCVKNIDSRMGRNPATGEEIQIPASKKISFKVSKPWKDAVNGVVSE